jgi:hypothetical protein
MCSVIRGGPACPVDGCFLEKNQIGMEANGDKMGLFYDRLFKQPCFGISTSKKIQLNIGLL